MKIEEFKKITKWDDSYTGKGLKLAIMEMGLGSDADTLYDEVINSTKSDRYDTDYKNKRSDNHSNLTGWIWRELFPDAEIYLLDNTKDESYQWCADNGIHIINMSISDTSANILPAIDKCFMITSAGNSGDNGETLRDTRAKYWLQVGAVDFEDEKFSLMDYSSWGRDKVDIATLSGIETPYGTFHGTSCSSPLAGGLIGQYFQAHKKTFGVYPNINQTYDFIDKHTHNIFLFDPDSDLKIGYGFLVLPEKYHFKKIELRFPKGESKSYTQALVFSDDNVITENILVPAEIVNGRTRMGVRDLSNLTGKFIQWNNEERKVEIYIQQGDH